MTLPASDRLPPPEADAKPEFPVCGLYAQLGNADFAAAVEQVSDALNKEGFGILTETDVQATMKNKLGIEVPAHCIFGARNPTLAHRALMAEPDTGLLLPGNAVVRQDADGRVTVGLIDSMAMLQVSDNPEVARVAMEARERLQWVGSAPAAG